MNNVKMFFWILFVLFAQISLDHPLTLGLLMIFIPVLFVIPLLNNREIKNIKFSPGIHLVFFLFGVTSIISLILSNDLKISLILVLLRIMSVYLFIAIIAVNISNTQIIRQIIYASYISYIIILCLSFIQNNYFQNAFSGFYKNPNTLGLVTIEFFILNLVHIYILIKEKKGIYNYIFPLGLSIVSIFIVFITESRTAFLIIFILILTFITIIILTVLKGKKIKSIVRTIVSLIVLIMGILIAINKIEILNHYYLKAISQFTERTTDFTAGRSILWSNALKEFNFWGNGIYSFEETYKNPPHNLFLSVIDNFGFIPFILFVIYVVLVFLTMFNSILKNGLDEKGFFGILVFVAFLGVSMVESIRLHYLVYLLFITGGIFSIKNRGKNN